MSKNNLIKIFYKELKWGKEEEMHEGLPVCVSILYFCLTHNRKKDSHRQMPPLHRSCPRPCPRQCFCLPLGVSQGWKSWACDGKSCTIPLCWFPTQMVFVVLKMCTSCLSQSRKYTVTSNPFNMSCHLFICIDLINKYYWLSPVLFLASAQPPMICAHPVQGNFSSLQPANRNTL